MALILASASPRRQQLLRLLTDNFTVRVPQGVSEHSDSTDPAGFVQDIARAKGAAAYSRFAQPGDAVLSADTVVALGGSIFGKPQNDADARRMLTALSGNTHEVYTAVRLFTAAGEHGILSRTEVTFYPIEPHEINWYIATGEPADKAGAYGIQGLGSRFVEGISGDYFNVMGLPVSALYRLLREQGLLQV